MARCSIPPTLQAGRSPPFSIGFVAAVRILKPFEDVIAEIHCSYNRLRKVCTFCNQKHGGSFPNISDKNKSLFVTTLTCSIAIEVEYNYLMNWK